VRADSATPVLCAIGAALLACPAIVIAKGGFDQERLNGQVAVR